MLQKGDVADAFLQSREYPEICARAGGPCWKHYLGPMRLTLPHGLVDDSFDCGDLWTFLRSERFTRMRLDSSGNQVAGSCATSGP